jgi:hypothetical protein
MQYGAGAGGAVVAKLWTGTNMRVRTAMDD